MTELAGVLVGNYFLLECLAREGITETYRARPTTRGGCDVILRLFRPQFPDSTCFREHFASEVEKVWRCHHEHILPLLEFGSGEELLYSATLLTETETLEHVLRRQQGQMIAIERAVQIVTQLCDAVDYAHAQNIVHGNIQPASIVMSDENDILLTNFGLRRAYQPGEPLVSQLGEGNSAYIAPEQALGMVTSACDIYALGVLLFRLLGGVLPYDGNEDEIALKHAEEPIPSLRIVRPDIPEAVDRVVQIALAKTPDTRFPSAAALAQALLEATMTEESRIVSDSPQRLLVVRSRRTAFSWARVAPLVTTTFLLFALVGASLFVFSLPQLRGQPFWNSLEMALTGHGQNRAHTGSSPSGPSVKPTATSKTSTVPQSLSQPTVKPTVALSPTPMPGVTPTPTPYGTPGTLICTSGTLTMNGSPYMEPFLQQVNNDYLGQCQQIQVTLTGGGSRTGLNLLQRNEVVSADSDLTARPARNLTDHVVAVLMCAVIVSPDVQISGLSSTDLQAIYQGQITNWSQVGGPDEAITVILRPSNDTVTTIFRTYVLGGMTEHVKGTRVKQNWAQTVAMTPGAIGIVPLMETQNVNVLVLPIDGASPTEQDIIQGSYQFWSVEHLYTQGRGSRLFQFYFAFLNSAPELSQMNQFGLVPGSKVPAGVLTSHLPGPEI
ncbi:MAG TPA: serine/threonine-protein kinase [Ktedonobacteraceae bacterium]|nr:serine/threonine-protein kinase [Ktedonobacteraceae bacterium]